MYIIDIQTLTPLGDICKLLRDEESREIILFETLGQAIEWCTNNDYILDRKISMNNDNKNYTYKFRKNLGNGTTFVYIHKCKFYTKEL